MQLIDCLINSLTAGAHDSPVDWLLDCLTSLVLAGRLVGYATD